MHCFYINTYQKVNSKVILAAYDSLNSLWSHEIFFKGSSNIVWNILLTLFPLICNNFSTNLIFFFFKKGFYDSQCIYLVWTLFGVPFWSSLGFFSPPWLVDISKLQSSLDLIFSPYTTTSHSSLSSHFSECSQHSLSHSLVNLEAILASSSFS